MNKALTLAAAAALALVITSAASAHAGISPGVVKTNTTQEFTLLVPTEEEGTTTTTVELTAPDGLSIFGFEDSPGWKREEVTQGSGEERTIKQVTWSGGNVPTEHYAVFRFIGSVSDAKDLAVNIRQTYANGKVVDWSGPESSDTPAPVIEGVSSIGGGGSSSTLSIIALVVAGIAVVLAVVGLLTRGRPVA
jgi:uncharacterized protein YcnI